MNRLVSARTLRTWDLLSLCSRHLYQKQVSSPYNSALISYTKTGSWRPLYDPKEGFHEPWYGQPSSAGHFTIIQYFVRLQNSCGVTATLTPINIGLSNLE